MEKYEYIRANLDCGSLSWEYKVEGLPPSKMSHDEEIDDTWTDDDIIDLTMNMLDVDKDQRPIISLSTY